MNNSTITELEPVRIEADGRAMRIAGLNERYGAGDPLDGAAQWARFASQFGKIPGQVESVAYGVCFMLDDDNGLDYLCGVEVSGEETVPDMFAQRHLPAQRYAVFAHEGHVSTLRRTYDSISKWLAQSTYEKPEGVNFFFERYDERFDPETATGLVEIWIPIRQDQ